MIKQQAEIYTTPFNSMDVEMNQMLSDHWIVSSITNIVDDRHITSTGHITNLTGHILVVYQKEC